MPSYFYRVRLELLTDASVGSCRPDDSGSFTIEAIHESLRPFCKRQQQQFAHQQRKSKTQAVASVNKSSTPSELQLAKGSTSTNLLTSSSRQCILTENTPHSHQDYHQQQQQQQINHEETSHNPITSNDTSTLNQSNTSPVQCTYDRRVDNIAVEGIDMVLEKGDIRSSRAPDNNQIAKGIGSRAIGGLATKGKYISLDHKVPDSVCGIIHLYRDGDPTPGLLANDDDPYFLKGSSLARNTSGRIAGYGGSGAGEGSQAAALSPEDCTTLCILAVPAYMSPPDFIGWVGQETKEQVSHFRMIRTERRNRYMVLMKFRDGRKAREWQREWTGKVFNSSDVSCV